MNSQINRASGIGLTALSLAALLTVLLGALVRAVLPGHLLPPEHDEGALARIFQLLIVALIPAGLLFVATADWTQPFRSLRQLAFPTTAVVLAFGILFYLEHQQ